MLRFGLSFDDRQLGGGRKLQWMPLDGRFAAQTLHLHLLNLNRIALQLARDGYVVANVILNFAGIVNLVDFAVRHEYR